MRWVVTVQALVLQPSLVSNDDCRLFSDLTVIHHLILLIHRIQVVSSEILDDDVDEDS